MPDAVAARFLLGVTLLAQGSFNQAEQHLSKALQLAPDNLEARKMLAQVRLQLSRPDAAMQVLMGAQSDEPDPQLDALVGKTYFQQGEVAEGLTHLERAVAAKPDDRNLKLDLAEGYLRAGQSRKSLDLLRSTPRIDTDPRRESLLLAALAQSGGVNAALAQVEAWVDEAPRDIALLNLAGTYLAQQRAFIRARAVLGKASALDPSNAQTLLSWAGLETAQGNAAAAKTWLEKALAIDPGNVPAQLELAELAIRRGDLAAARQGLEIMRKKDAAAIAPRLQLLRINLRENDSAKAAEVIRELLVDAHDRADVLNAVGSVYLEANRYEEALARFRQATDIDGGNATYWMNTARAQLALDHRSAAREALQRALNERPDWVSAVSALTMLDLRDNRSDAAIKRVAALRKALPKDSAALMLEGNLFMTLGQFDRAAAAFTAAGELQNDAQIAVKTYFARKAGKLAVPQAPLEAWLKQSPDDLMVRNMLAQAYQQMGQSSRAIEQYQIVLAANEKDVAALNNLAWLYHEIKDPRALDTAQRAYALAPKSPEVADTYGWVLVQTGKVTEGLAVLRKIVDGGKAEGETEYHYAAALAQAGERTQARERLAKLLAEPGGFASQSEARRLLEQLGGA
jgi:putative PEP-CTERM system TPR-repeat lipoprotein